MEVSELFLFLVCGIGMGFALFAIGFLAGAWVHHKGVSAGNGVNSSFVGRDWVHHKGVSAGNGVNSSFVGRDKGEVFTIQDESGADFPESDDNPAEQHVLKRASRFMQGFGGE